MLPLVYRYEMRVKNAIDELFEKGKLDKNAWEEFWKERWEDKL